MEYVCLDWNRLGIPDPINTAEVQQKMKSRWMGSWGCLVAHRRNLTRTFLRYRSSSPSRQVNHGRELVHREEVALGVEPSRLPPFRCPSDDSLSYETASTTVDVCTSGGDNFRKCVQSATEVWSQIYS